jgi:hypothetical protein
MYYSYSIVYLMWSHILSLPPLFPVAPTLEHKASVKRFVSHQFLNPNTVGRNPWTGDQPIVRPLPTQHNTTGMNADIYASSGIRNRNPSVRAGEDSSHLRSCGHCDRPWIHISVININFLTILCSITFEC